MTQAAERITYRTVVRWDLKNTIDRYQLTNAAIAEALGNRANTVTDLKNAELSPAIDGNRIGEIIDALNIVANRDATELVEIYGPIDLSDLIYQDALKL